MHRPSGIIFDFGDTVLRYVSADWPAACNRLLELAEDSNGVTVKDISRLNTELAREVFEAREASAIELHYEDFIRLQCDILGLSLKVNYAEAAQETWRAAITYEPVDGIVGALEELESNRVKMGILSNSVFSASILEEELAKHGMDHFFSFVVSTADYGLRKPHQRIVELAVRKMGFPEEEIWFVGDKPNYDIKSALNCGLFPVWYNPEKKSHPLSSACLQAKDWHEFTETIRPLFAR